MSQNQDPIALAITYHRGLKERNDRLLALHTQNRGKRLFGEVTRFILVATLIFGATFGALNYSAYAKQLTFFLQTDNTVPVQPLGSALKSDLAAVSNTDPVESIVTTTDSQKSADLLPLKNLAKTKVDSLAAVDLSIAPPRDYLAISRLGIRAPIVEPESVNYGGEWKAVEDQIESALQRGVVHLPGTALPGEKGNVFITGHSSFYPWDPGRYKDIFALLPKVQVGDVIEVFHDEKYLRYRVAETREVEPSATNVLAPTDDHRLTLMTCVPVGTALHRLIVTAFLE